MSLSLGKATNQQILIYLTYTKRGQGHHTKIKVKVIKLYLGLGLNLYKTIGRSDQYYLCSFMLYIQKNVKVI